MSYKFPDGVDPQSDDWDLFDRDLAELAEAYEWENWGDIIGDGQNVDLDKVRPGVYPTPQDAIWNAYDRGILDYITVLWDEETGFYYIMVDY